jgi:hypothetical protein
MALLRGIGRAAPLLAAGAAAAWYLRRQGVLSGQARPELPWPPEDEPEPPPAPAPPDEPLAAHVEAVEAVSDASDVTSVVEDLLAIAPEEEREIVDAEVVEEELDERVRAALAEVQGLPPGSVEVESSEGVVWLRGEIERPEAIEEAERLVAALEGVTGVRNYLHLPGTPPPSL